MLMVMSLLVFYFIPLIFYDSFILKNYITFIYSWVTVIVITLIIFNFSLISNIAYLNMSLKYEKSYALKNRVLARIEQLDEIESTNKIAVIGKPNKYIDSNFYDVFIEKTPMMTGAVEEIFINDSKRLRNMFEHFMGVQFEQASDIEIKKLIKNETVAEMPVWPATDSVILVDDFIVIKFPDE